jgi:hypothetical protein
MRQNHRILGGDACDPLCARNVLADLFKSRSRLEAENMLLRHQLNLALRRRSPRLRVQGNDRVLLVWMIRLWPSLLDSIQSRSA